MSAAAATATAASATAVLKYACREIERVSKTLQVILLPFCFFLAIFFQHLNNILNIYKAAFFSLKNLVGCGCCARKCFVVVGAHTQNNGKCAETVRMWEWDSKWSGAKSNPTKNCIQNCIIFVHNIFFHVISLYFFVSYDDIYAPFCSHHSYAPGGACSRAYVAICMCLCVSMILCTKSRQANFKGFQ